MRRWGRALPIVLVAVATVWGAGASRAEEGKPTVPGLPEAEGKARLARLQTRVNEWWNARKRQVHACTPCGGRGLVRYGRSWNTCRACQGRKRVLDAKVYRTLHYDLKTEAFRLLEDVRDRLEDRYDRDAAGEFPIDIDRFKVERVQLCDAEHAEVFVLENKDSVSRPQRWVFVGKEWFVWDALSKEGWPGEAAPNASLPTAPKGTPIEGPQRADLEAALGGVNLVHTANGIEASGTTLLLTFVRKPDVGAGAARMAVAQEAVSVVRAIFAPRSTWSAVHLAWLTD